MPQFETFSLLRWIHFVCLATAGGGMVACLLLSGFEESREDLRGLAATMWSRVVAWALRLALVVGLALAFTLRLNPAHHPWFVAKLVLVVILIALSEMTPKALAAAKRGSALLAMLLYLLTTFLTFNHNVLGVRPSAPAATGK
ncbi:MAG: hypothetical protein HY823_04545 [Acidobacteria bacterium]|nr:hypothetical protein [Acidobacteriota bacterium]